MGMTKPTRVLVASFPDREPGNGSGARERIQAGRHTVLLFFQRGACAPLESLSPLRRGPPPGEKRPSHSNNIARFKTSGRYEVWQCQAEAEPSRSRAESCAQPSSASSLSKPRASRASRAKLSQAEPEAVSRASRAKQSHTGQAEPQAERNRDARAEVPRAVASRAEPRAASRAAATSSLAEP